MQELLRNLLVILYLISSNNVQLVHFSYLNTAVSHSTQAIHISQIETEDALLARELRATCLLNLANYAEAEEEAAHILDWAPFNGKALYIYAESLYLQCKVHYLSSIVLVMGRC